jgi:hypothetical protein
MVYFVLVLCLAWVIYYNRGCMKFTSCCSLITVLACKYMKSKKHDRGKMDLAGFILRSPYLRFWANWFSHWTQRCQVNLIRIYLVLRILCLPLKNGSFYFSWGERQIRSILSNFSGFYSDFTQFL